MSDYVNNTSKYLRNIRYVESGIRSLGTTFRRLYNDQLAEELYELANILEDSASGISDEMGRKISGDLEQARSNFFGAFNGVLKTLEENSNDE